MATEQTIQGESKTCPIRVPESLHRKLKVRAAVEGKTLLELVTPVLEALIVTEPEPQGAR